jgi:hypothetical protein
MLGKLDELKAEWNRVTLYKYQDDHQDRSNPDPIPARH